MVIKKSWFVLPYKLKKISFKGETDMRYPDKFAEKLILHFTKPKDKVFDPFAGFGTTLFAAQKLGRIGVGIEFDKDRYEFVKGRLKKPNKIIYGDALKIKSYKLPAFDFCLTSPPYMRSFDKENPFTNYTKSGSYSKYLKIIGKIYSQIKKVMKKNAIIVVEISNTFGKNHPMTPLAWDVAKEISKIFFLEREIIYCIKEGKLSPNLSNHSYCLIFRNK